MLDLRDGFGGMWLDYIEKFMSEDENGSSISQIYDKPLIGIRGHHTNCRSLSFNRYYVRWTQIPN